MSDSVKKSIVKTISWRIIAFIITTALVFALSNDHAIAITIGIADMIIKLIAYYIHERLWNNKKI